MTETAVEFARALRTAGLDVPVGSVITYVEALHAVGTERSDSVYWAGRATLVRRPEDIPLYNEVFGSFWLGRTSSSQEAGHHHTVDLDVAADDCQADDVSASPSVLAVRYSAQETLRHRDFA